jgi:PAS domain S-box-containing protein
LIRRYRRARGEGRFGRRCEFFRAIANDLGEGILVVDRNGRLIYVNPTAERLLGWTAAELLGKPMHQAIHFQHADRTPHLAEECPLLAAIRAGTSIEVPSDAFTHKDGAILPVAYTATRVSADELSGTVIVFRDVTLQERREDALVENAARYRILVDMAADAILVIDESSVIVFANPAVEKVFGYRPEELIGQSLTVLMPATTRPIDLANLKGSLETSEARFSRTWTEMPAVRKNGQAITVEFTFGEYIRHGRRLFIGYARDVTERKRGEQERERLLAQVTEEEKHTKELAEQAQRATSTLRTLIDTMPAGVIVSDAKGAIILANPAANALLGGSVTGTAYGPSGGYTLLRLDGSPFPPKELPLPVAIERGEVTRDVSIRVRYQDGTERVLLASGSPVRDPAGAITGAVAVLQDITERVRTEEALRKSEEGLAEAQRIARLGNWDWDIRTNQLHWSDEVYRLFGLAVGSLSPTYETFLSFVHPDDREQVKQAVQAALDRKRPYSVEHRIVRQDGEVRIVHEMGDVIFDESGHPVRMIGTVQDITERRQAEEERDRFLAREQALAQIAEALVHELELSRVVDVVMTQTQRVLGAEIIGVWLADPARRQLDLLAFRGKPLDVVEKLRHLSYDAPSLTARAARTGQTQVIEEVERMRTELPLMYEVAEQEKARSALSIPLKSRGRLVGVVTYASRAARHFSRQELEFNETIADLFAVAIENAHLYEEVRQALRLREEFMATAAHELRTPITVIKGRAQLLLKTDARNEQARRGLESIVIHADQMGHLVDDLLAVVRVRPGLSALRPERFDLSALIREIVKQTERLTAQRRFRLETNGSLPVNADRALIAELLGRLLETAIRYSPKDGMIEVEARRGDGEAIVSITYPGIAISPERRPHVFEPFYELVPTGEPEYVGMVGLGLYLSKLIVDAHGGRIWFDWKPAKGSTFSFSLPLV